MKITLLLYLLAAAVLVALLFPGVLPRLLRRLGKSTGDVARMGKELATGQEVQGSPLARYEVRAGEMVLGKLLREHPVSPRADLQEKVSRIGACLAAHALRKEIPYSFTVVESTEPNAFAVPGGWILITQGLLELCKDQPDRIAGVLGHEIVHVDRFHAMRHLAASMAARAGARLLSLGRSGLLSWMSSGMEELIARGYRQDQELEADFLGSRLAQLAGFQPRGLLEILEEIQRLQPEETGLAAQVSSYFKLHPPPSARIAKLRALT
jgi:predicted Zn-dependent protease